MIFMNKYIKKLKLYGIWKIVNIKKKKNFNFNAIIYINPWFIIYVLNTIPV